MAETTWRSGCRRSFVADGTAVDHLPEDVMDTSSATFLACGAFFALSFVMIGAFWFVERLRGASAPHV
jgi:hypothetical protein